MTLFIKTYKKNIRIRSIGIFVLIFVLMCSSQTSVFAKKVTVASKINKETIPKELITPVAVDMLQAASKVKPVLEKADFVSDFKWDSVKVMKGVFTSTHLYFSTESYWDTKYAYVEIAYNVSQLITNKPASLTFSINDHPFYSCQVNYVDNNKQTLYVLIPKELLLEKQSNHLEISGYVRLYEDQGCIDDFSDANWIRFDENSFVSVGYNIKDDQNYISTYPYPFISSLDTKGIKTSLSVSNAAEDSEIAAAMLIFSNLSQYTKGKNEISVGLWDDFKDDTEKNNIYIGLTKNIPQELKKYLQDESNLKEQAVIMRVRNDKGKQIMLIVSDDPDCLMEAARLLSDKSRSEQEKNNITHVKKGTSETVRNSRKLSDMVVGSYTVKSIVGSGLKFYGPFHQKSEIYVPVSSDYTVSQESKMTLKFRYSENLDFNRSMFTVYWGDIPITSKKLEKDKASGDELTFFMPADLVGSVTSKIGFAFDLEIPDLICTPRQDQMPWAYISEDSVLYMPQGEAAELLLDHRPAPFQKDGKFNDVMLVVSETPTKNELTLLGRIVAVYGMGADAYGNLKVQRASEFSKEDADYNIIAVGTPLSNRFIAELNQDLYFKYNNDGSQFITNEKLILSENYAGNIGTIQLIPSPYGPERSILVLTGPNNKTLGLIREMISEEKKRWELKDDCVIVDADETVTTFLMQNKSIQDSKPTVAEILLAHKDSLIFTIVSTGVMIIFFLATVLILIRIRRRNKKNK